jgi:peptidoglycan/xylan/chitin deacetylase (PgdA/CDA1 family)
MFMNSVIRTAVFAVADILGINSLFRQLTAHKVRVLMYHGITDRPQAGFRWTVLDRGTFRRQMDYLAKYFRVVKASELWCNESPDKSAPGLRAIITFDDGLTNTLSVAQPILAELSLPGVCFVVPGLAGHNRQIWADDLFEFLMGTASTKLDWESYGLGTIELSGTHRERGALAEKIIGEMKGWPQERRLALMNHVAELMPLENPSREDYRLMSLEEVAQMAAAGTFEIGLHSNTHPIMATLSSQDQYHEVRTAVSTLRERNIPFVPVFAYPNGRLEDFNDGTIAVLKQLEFKTGLTTVDGLWSTGGDRYQVERIAVGADITMWEFRARLSGLFYFLRSLLGRGN